MFVGVLMVPLLAMTALVIDVGFMYKTRRELQGAADAAALSSVADLPNAGTVKLTAQQYATANHPGHGTIVAPGDVDLGFWDTSTRSFTAGGLPLNAVRVTARRSDANGNPLQLFFAGVIGRPQADVGATAVAALEAAEVAEVIPLSLRDPGFGPVDPEILEDNAGKPGPSKPANGSFFQVGERVTLFTFGKGDRGPVHLALDLEAAGIEADVSKILEGREPPVPIGTGDHFIVGQGSGQGGLGSALGKRLERPSNHPLRTVIVPVLRELPGSRDADGQLAGPVRIADFVAVHLDAVVEEPIPGEPGKTVRMLVGTVTRLTVTGGGGSGPGRPTGAGGATVTVISLVG